MYNLLGLSFYCKVYKKNPNIRIFFNEKFIDEYDIETHTNENLKPHLKLYNLVIPPTPLNLSISLEIKNSDSNYNNGFMTKSTLLRFHTFHLIPFNDINTLDNMSKLLYNKKDFELTYFNLIPYTRWLNQENIYVENPSHQYIGNSGIFTCHLFRDHNNFKPISLIESSNFSHKIDQKYGYSIQSKNHHKQNNTSIQNLNKS